MNEEQDLSYDEDDAVKFIRNYLPQELKEKFSDNEINYIIDLVYEFYESKGFVDEDDDTVVEVDEDELMQFVIQNAQRDQVGHFQPEEIAWIVQGELGYCDSIHLFE